MPKAILAKIVPGNNWECQLCPATAPRRLQGVTGMMIHLVTVHHINLEFQSFPPGLLQEGMIFHLVASTDNVSVFDLDEKYGNLFTSPLTLEHKQPSPYSDK